MLSSRAAPPRPPSSLPAHDSRPMSVVRSCRRHSEAQERLLAKLRGCRRNLNPASQPSEPCSTCSGPESQLSQGAAKRVWPASGCSKGPGHQRLEQARCRAAGPGAARSTASGPLRRIAPPSGSQQAAEQPGREPAAAAQIAISNRVIPWYAVAIPSAVCPSRRAAGAAAGPDARGRRRRIAGRQHEHEQRTRAAGRHGLSRRSPPGATPSERERGT